MTDKTTGVIFYTIGDIYFAIYGSDNFRIFSKNDNEHFSFDSQNLIRVEKNKPMMLLTETKSNSLYSTNKDDSLKIITALVNNKQVSLRYYTWPEYLQQDITVQDENLSVIYKKAAKEFCWTDLTPSTTPDISSLKKSNIELYVYTDERDINYTSITQKDDATGIQLIRDGDDVLFKAGIWEILHLRKSKKKGYQFVYNEYPIIKTIYLINEKREMESAIDLPKSKSEAEKVGIQILQAIASNAPLGKLRIDYNKELSLSAFLDIWTYGVDYFNLPKIDSLE
jgi:hypothetical protein